LLEQASAHGHLLGLHFSKKSLGQLTLAKKARFCRNEKKIVDGTSFRWLPELVNGCIDLNDFFLRIFVRSVLVKGFNFEECFFKFIEKKKSS